MKELDSQSGFSGDYNDLKNKPTTTESDVPAGFGRIDHELEDIRQKVEMVTNQAAQHYENIEGIVDDYGKKAILTPVTALIFAAWSVVCVGIGAWVF